MPSDQGVYCACAFNAYSCAPQGRGNAHKAHALKGDALSFALYPYAFDVGPISAPTGGLSADWATAHRRRHRTQHSGNWCQGDRPGAEAVS